MRTTWKYIALCGLELLALFLLGSLLFRQAGQTVPVVDLSDQQNEVAVSAPQEKEATMLFVGDMMFDRYVAKKIAAHDNPLLPFEKIKTFLQGADFLMGNLEGPISTRGQNQGSIYSFRFEPEGTLRALRDTGFDLLTLANNHIFDYGLVAALDTVAALKEAGIASVGFGANDTAANAPVVRTVGDAQVAFFAYTEFYGSSARAGKERAGLSTWERSQMLGAIRAARANEGIDVIVVNLHWGVEYATQANDFQKQLAHEFVAAGADLVVGHHPHVVQEVEYYSPFTKGRGPLVVRDFDSKSLPPVGVLPFVKGDGVIAYSLGNFVFDQNFSDDTRKGLVLQVDLRGQRIEKVTPIEVRFTAVYQPFIPSVQ